ncbi:MAG: phage holin family protein [Cellvibrio sp.]
MELFKSNRSSTDAGAINPLQLLGILRSASGALIAQASLHAELAQVEWEVEKQRLGRMIIFTLVAFACFLCLIFFVGMGALAISWDTPYRIHTFIGLVLCYALALVWAGFKLKALSALGEQSFAATRAEIAADIDLIKSAL